MIENIFFSSKTHLIVNLMIWCTGTLKFLDVSYNLPKTILMNLLISFK